MYKHELRIYHEYGLKKYYNKVLTELLIYLNHPLHVISSANPSCKPKNVHFFIKDKICKLNYQ